jgi:rhodanese-related sulfurtransferase
VKRSLLIAFVVVAAVAANAHALGWTLINAKIRSEFPQVQRITTAQLAAWLADQSRPAPLLLDVRTRAEFDVSHLRGAVHVAPDASASLLREPKDRPIVTYCSVGYRSGAFAQKLQAAGYTNVANLEGSIFRWANEGRPVFRGAEQAAEVHPFNRTWGLLLRKNLRADVAAADAKR